VGHLDHIVEDKSMKTRLCLRIGPLAFLIYFLYAAFLDSYAQGTIGGLVGFANRTAVGDAPVFMPDCVTKVFGTGFQAQLYAGPAGSAQSSLVPILPSTPFRSTPAAAAGLWVPITLTIPFVPAGQPAVLQARVWETAAGSYEAAVASGRLYGASLPIVLILGSPMSQAPPPDTTGLQSFCLVPEPSTFVIGLLGAGVLLGWCRSARRA
jgi:hypothetical protein